MRCLIFVWFLWSCHSLYSQDAELNEQQLEELSESDEAEIEDEYALQQLHILKKNPVNINSGDISPDELPMLSALQVQNLLAYRQLLGDLISVYELQAVPGFSIELIKSLLPYITIADKENAIKSMRQRFRNGEHHMIARPSLPSKIYFRYKYQYRHLLQYGLVGERDAGEKSLIDFYSAHLFARNIGIIKSLAIGDYTLNLGQGLIHWQSQAFRKSASVLNIKRQSEIIKPYHSAGEFNFQRGVAVTVRKNNYEATVFGSLRKLTANKDVDQTLGEVITSINTSGLHRTAAEIEKKNNVSLLSYGGNVKYVLNKGHVGINAISYQYSLPLLKRDEAYNLFALRGNNWMNYSLDYSYTWKNFHLFGEFAKSSNSGMATINGVMSSLNNQLDITIVHRNIAPRYQSIYGNAFTENTMPTNESGFYLGVSAKPVHAWRIDFYSDVFKFPWLKYRVDAPSYGLQYLFQFTWKPSRQVEFYSRFRFKSKLLNVEAAERRYPENRVQENWRAHISIQVSKTISLRARAESCWFRKHETELAETGYILYSDIIYKPMNKWYSANARIQFFECESFDTRIYAYENDLLFSSSIPFLYNNGMRTYLNMRGKVNLEKKIGVEADFGVKISITHYKPMPKADAPEPPSSVFATKFQLLLTPVRKKTSLK